MKKTWVRLINLMLTTESTQLVFLINITCLGLKDGATQPIYHLVHTTKIV